jgi:hypothetical protein
MKGLVNEPPTVMGWPAIPKMNRISVFLMAALLAGSACAASANVSGAPPPEPSASAGASPTASPEHGLPSLLYESVEAARGDVGRMRLDLHFVISGHTTIAYRPGTVLAQKPEPGTIMQEKQTVGVTVSRAPACDPSYPTVCIAPFKSHVECKDITARNFQVRPPDTYHFDKDHNGIGCPKVIKPPRPKHSP